MLMLVVVADDVNALLGTELFAFWSVYALRTGRIALSLSHLSQRVCGSILKNSTALEVKANMVKYQIEQASCCVVSPIECFRCYNNARII
jgi:hypothetical protein